MYEALDSLKIDKGALLVEVANHGNRNLDLSSRNLDRVELVMAFEEAFDIEIPDEDAEKINTVQDAVTYIGKHAKAAK